MIEQGYRERQKKEHIELITIWHRGQIRKKTENTVSNPKTLLISPFQNGSGLFELGLNS